MEVTDWLIIAATLLGPILAVQAQKFVERIRERNQRKLWVFQQLMATRRARLSQDHVHALNMIDLAFYGSGEIGKGRTRREQKVLDSWKEYLDHLETRYDDAAAEVWWAKSDELFVNLLQAIATDVNYTFDRVQLKKSAYSPMAHGRLEEENDRIRKLVIDVLSGDKALTMNVESLPFDQAALDAQIELHQSFKAALSGDGALNVVVKESQE